MLIAIVGLFIGITLFLCFLYAFERGLRLAKTVSEGKDIPKIKNPIKAVSDAITEVKETKEQTEANKAYNEGLQAILSYTGDVKG